LWAVTAGLKICSVKMHTFAKIKILCNAIAGRVREPRRIVIPGLKEVLPLVVEDLHQQVEAAAEVRGKMKPHVGLITKAVMPKDQPVVHSTKAVITTVQPVDHLKRAEMEKDQPAVHSTEVAMVKDQHANHMKEVVMAKGQPVAHLIKSEMV
jgi:hypothetical protein